MPAHACSLVWRGSLLFGFMSFYMDNDSPIQPTSEEVNRDTEEATVQLNRLE